VAELSRAQKKWRRAFSAPAETETRMVRATPPKGVARGRGGPAAANRSALIRAFCRLDGPAAAAAEASGAK
jgi:hypothetical protein